MAEPNFYAVQVVPNFYAMQAVPENPVVNCSTSNRAGATALCKMNAWIVPKPAEPKQPNSTIGAISIAPSRAPPRQETRTAAAVEARDDGVCSPVGDWQDIVPLSITSHTGLKEPLSEEFRDILLGFLEDEEKSTRGC